MSKIFASRYTFLRGDNKKLASKHIVFCICIFRMHICNLKLGLTWLSPLSAEYKTTLNSIFFCFMNIVCHFFKEYLNWNYFLCIIFSIVLQLIVYLCLQTNYQVTNFTKHIIRKETIGDLYFPNQYVYIIWPERRKQMFPPSLFMDAWFYICKQDTFFVVLILMQECSFFSHVRVLTY